MPTGRVTYAEKTFCGGHGGCVPSWWSSGDACVVVGGWWNCTDEIEEKQNPESPYYDSYTPKVRKHGQ